MYVIATAGHVDHGKSTLVRALTGINPDRLREEQEREMTIDLGFAWLNLPDGEMVGIVDVPGHIDFIENMLAGVGGIDLALLVIAADEGPMPQTHEHLAILSLLHVPRAVVALTKADLAPGEDWLELVSGDIRRLLSDSPFADAPIVPVSARSGTGLPALVQALHSALQETRALRETGALGRRDVQRARLPVDRSFTMPGFGTVVTGTLLDGSFSVGDEVEVMPQGLRARIRGLQTHQRKLDIARPGSRTAINLSGVAVEQVARGSVVAQPGLLLPSTLLDVHLEMLAGQFVRQPFRHNTEIKLFCGTGETIGRVRLLQGSELAPGVSGWAQLQLANPVAAVNGDRFIIRLPSPSLTVGGGEIVDTHPVHSYRRRGGTVEDAVLLRLQALLEGTPSQRLEKVLQQMGFSSRADAQAQSGLRSDEFVHALDELVSAGSAVIGDDVIALAAFWRDRLAQIIRLAGDFHLAQPLAEGISRESLRSQMKLAPRSFNALIAYGVRAGELVDDNETVRLAEHQVRLNSGQQRQVDKLLARFQAQPFSTPSVKECRAAVGDEVYDVLLRQDRLVQVSADVVFLRETYQTAVQGIRETIAHSGPITAAQVRDAFHTTRKYALALLEYMDETGITRREGDARMLAEY